jgi:hypothetical protein
MELSFANHCGSPIHRETRKIILEDLLYGIYDADKIGTCERHNAGRETKTGIETMTVTVTSKDFGYSVKFLKKNGYSFDSASKSWTGTKDVSFLVNEGYAKPIAVASPMANDDMIVNVEA